MPVDRSILVGFSATVHQDQLLKREQLGALVSPTRSIQTLCLAEILLASLEILKPTGGRMPTRTLREMCLRRKRR